MSILIVTGIEGARNCAAVVGAQLKMEVDVAEGHKAALAALRGREYDAVVVDETMADCNPSAVEAIWIGDSPANQLRPIRRGSAGPRDPGRIAPARARADAGTPGGGGGDGERIENNGGWIAFAIAAGAGHERSYSATCRQASRGGRVGWKPAATVKCARRDAPGFRSLRMG